MKLKELKDKYGNEALERVFYEGYLDGCSVDFIDGKLDISEEDVLKALKEMRGWEIKIKNPSI